MDDILEYKEFLGKKSSLIKLLLYERMNTGKSCAAVFLCLHRCYLFKKMKLQFYSKLCFGIHYFFSNNFTFIILINS